MPKGVYKRKPFTPEHCANLSEGSKNSEAVKAYHDSQKGIPKPPETCAKMSRIKKQWFIDHPEAIEAARLRCVEYWADQDNRNEMSEIITNSEAAKIQADKMRGGNDICDHHYIYDHDDLSKHTMKMTRSDHQKLHNLLRKLGYKVPHINR